MPIVEFFEWASYYKLEKYDYNQVDVNTAQIAMMISSYLGGKLKVDDVLPQLESQAKQEEEKEQDLDKLFAGFQGLAMAIEKGKCKNDNDCSS